MTTNSQNIILEIRAGTGGNEAGLFAADLLRMYQRFAESQGWKVKELSRSEGGLGQIKEVRVEISGAEPYEMLKFESGVHRVQRIPKTERYGRIHTSTATVAVLPSVKVSEYQSVKVDPKDLKIETFRASAPGGQHMQKSETAVRVSHLPTGITVSCQDERSQHQNREKAMGILRERLHKRQLSTINNQQSVARRKQIGTAERAEKIRTYHFPQNRLTDHRLKKSFYNLEKIMDGDLSPILELAGL